jgi:aspartate/methionine/tyrosine aminotransferase
LIPLWYGESDLATPGFIADAAAQAVKAGHTLYVAKRGIPELRAALARYLTGLHGRSIAAERVVATSSGMNAIMLVTQALIDPGDNAVLVAPVWPNLGDTVRVMDGEPREVPLAPTDAGGWKLDIDRTLAACDARTRILFVNSPNNPTGWTMSRDEAAVLLTETRKRGIYLVADEVYSRLIYSGVRAAPSLLELAEPEDRVVVVNSFSKAWAMTGWRLGWMVAPPEIHAVIDALVEINTSCAPPFVQHAGIAALERGEDFVAEMREHCRRGRDILIQGLARFPRVHVKSPAGAFYAFCRVDGMSDSLAFAHKLAAEASVGVAPGRAFGPAGEGYLRLCFARSAADLEAALDRIAPYLE